MSGSVKPEDLLQVFADVLDVPVDQLDADSSPDVVESWDSIAHLYLVMALEQEFDVEFDPDDIVELLSVRLTAENINRLINNNGGGA